MFFFKHNTAYDMRIGDWSSDVCSSDLAALAEDLARIEQLWIWLLERSGGPFLFGAFTAADAMYAPVASRIQTYELPCSDTVAGYVATIQALPAFQEWLAKAVLERWVVEDDEIDMIQMRAESAAEERKSK